MLLKDFRENFKLIWSFSRDLNFFHGILCLSTSAKAFAEMFESFSFSGKFEACGDFLSN